MSRYGAPRWAGVVLVSMVIGVGLGLAAPSTSPVGEAPALSDLTRTSPTVWVAHLSGLAAGYVAIVLIALMSRWPLLERRIGTGRLIRWHARGGRLVVALILVHAAFATMAWASMRHLELGASALAVVRMPGVGAATVGLAAMLIIGVASIRAARRRVRYEVWQTIHLLGYLAVALGLAHQLAGPDLAGRPPLQVAWAVLYIVVFGLAVHYRVLVPARGALRHRLRVSEVTREADDTVSIMVTGHHLDELGIEPGQFLRWRFLSANTVLAALPFSLSAPPTRQQLRLTVKAAGDGSRALQTIEPGTRVVVEGPYGRLTGSRRRRPNVVLIAGGIGITPLRVLFETLPLPDGGDLLLLYRTEPGRVLFRDELDALAQRRGARVRYLLRGDRGQLTGAFLLGRVPDLIERDVFICGPPAMTAAVGAELVRLGLPRAQLHIEALTF